MVEGFTIYSDESGSDKSLNNRGADYLNFDKSNSFRYYVRSYISVSNDCLQSVQNDFVELEKRLFNQEFSNGKEIHSKDKIKISGTKGIENLKENTLDFIEELLNFCDKITVNIVILNKMEYIVQNSIKFIQKNSGLEKKVIYSLAKLFENQQTEELMAVLFSDPTSITKKKFISALKAIELSLRDKPLKRTELRAVEEIIDLVKNDIIQLLPQRAYKWNYEFEVRAFLDLLQTDKLNIIFDEGNAVKIVMDNNKSSESITTLTNNSAEVPGLRLSDWFATFFGKLLRSISEALRVKDGKVNKANNETVLDIPFKWFDLTKQQFKLCKKIIKCIADKKIIFEIGYFADSLIFLVGYLDFVSSFETYEQFIGISTEQLSKQFNIQLSKIWHHYYSNKNILFNPKDLMSGILSDKVLN